MSFSHGRKRTRGKSGSYQSLYKTHQWRALRAQHLRANKYCQCPHCKGNDRPAQIVDHIIPHRGCKARFFDPSNLMAMNKQCHDKFKQSQEAGGHGFLSGYNDNGEPLSEEHEWWARD